MTASKPSGSFGESRRAARGRDDEFEVAKSGRRRSPGRVLQVLCQQYFALRPFRLARLARPNDSKVPGIVNTPAGGHRLHPLQCWYYSNLYLPQRLARP
jgi:hypothetical protein